MESKPIKGLGQLLGFTLIAGALLLGAVIPADAATLTMPACLAKKLKEWGKLRQCQATENRKGLQGKEADPGKCQVKFDDKLAKLNAKATKAAIVCRYGDNGDETVTDYDTGLQWEQKTDDCPAGHNAVGGYTTSFPSMGIFTSTVDASGTRWTGTADDSVFGSISCSGSVTGTTFTGTCLDGAIGVSGSYNCSDYSMVFSISGFVSGSGFGVATPTDPRDPYEYHGWSNSGTAPDGTAFTTFLATLNNCEDDGMFDPPTGVTGGFAGHCDWRLPSIVELQTIVDLSAPGCGTGSPCIDPAFGPTKAFRYWSATTSSDHPDLVWYVDFFGGLVGVDYKSRFIHSVRGVRSGL